MRIIRKETRVCEVRGTEFVREDRTLAALRISRLCQLVLAFEVG